MSIAGIFTSAVSGIAEVSQVASTGKTRSVAHSSEATGDSTHVSSAGQFLSKLKDLEASDPGKAKQVLGSIADKLRSAAGHASGDAASRLGDLANRFEKAASSGDLSSLSVSTAPAAMGNRGMRAYAKQQSQHQGDDVASTLASITSQAL